MAGRAGNKPGNSRVNRDRKQTDAWSFWRQKTTRKQEIPSEGLGYREERMRGTYSRKDAAYRANIIEEVLENVTVGILKKNVSEDVDLDVGTQETEEIQSSVSEMQPKRNLPIVRDSEKIRKLRCRKKKKSKKKMHRQDQPGNGPPKMMCQECTKENCGD